MTKFIIGSIAGIVTTLFVQKLYNKHGHFYAFVNGINKDMSTIEKQNNSETLRPDTEQ
jgi:hypothetical protein